MLFVEVVCHARQYCTMHHTYLFIGLLQSHYLISKWNAVGEHLVLRVEPEHLRRAESIEWWADHDIWGHIVHLRHLIVHSKASLGHNICSRCKNLAFHAVRHTFIFSLLLIDFFTDIVFTWIKFLFFAVNVI